MGLILPLKMFLSFGICASKPGERTHRLWVALFHGIMPPIAGGSRSSLWCTSSFGCGGCEIWLWGLVVIVFLRKWVPWNLEKYLLWRPSWLSMDALGCTSSTSGWVMGGGRFNCGRDIKLYLSVVEFGFNHNGWHFAGQLDALVVLVHGWWVVEDLIVGARDAGWEPGGNRFGYYSPDMARLA